MKVLLLGLLVWSAIKLYLSLPGVKGFLQVMLVIAYFLIALASLFLLLGINLAW